MTRQPIIAITPAFNESRQQLRLARDYADAIDRAGGLGLILTLPSDLDKLESMLCLADGILLTGGPDLDAVHFSEENTISNGTISPFRDQLDLAVCRYAMTHQVPILGICRGLQVMTVAGGGNLYQDITQMTGRKLQHDQQAPDWYPAHAIQIEEGSRVFGWFNQTKAGVNSFHHQGIKTLAPGYQSTAFTSDGTIEAIEHQHHPFAVGVQWHPELMWRKNKLYLAPFQALIQACLDH